MSRMLQAREFIVPVGMIASILVILVPMPPLLLDLFLAANITVAVIVVLTTVYVKQPLEFSVFPTLLLAVTLGRLVLNVASTRLILTRAEFDGMYAAGGVIKSFGEFVAGDRLVVGVIIFVIIVVIQFVVITKGATRISEVAARFALDGMPGRQMAIDADLNAGIIDEKEAQRRREEITRQADFYGAMDGASKFVRGDAVAGILITLINVVGGFIIGVVQMDKTFTEAAELFTKLTIGDGLVTQIPAFFTSVAAALLTTRSTQKVDLPVEFLQQLFSRPEALIVAGGFVGLLVFTHLPTVPLLMIGTGCIGLAVMLKRQTRSRNTQQAAQEAEQQSKAARPEERIEDYLAVDPMELEIGVGLIPLADPSRGGDLLSRITGVRRNIASEMGIVLPKVRIRDNLRLGENQYRIKIANNPVAEGEVRPDLILAMASGMAQERIPGIPTKDPVFDQPAVWIEPGAKDQAAMFGYTPVEPAAVLATHLENIAKRHADELFTRDAAQHLVDELKKTSPAVVTELIPDPLKLAEVQQVLQMLLREEVPIRNLATILETLGDYAPRIKDPVWLTEYVRARLARTICTRWRDGDNRLHVITMDPAMEDRIAAGIDKERGLLVRMSPKAIEKTCQRIAAEASKLTQAGRRPILLVSPQIRAGVRHLTTASLPRLVVLSYNEITRDTAIESVGVVSDG
jgi:flagellar biosynthesis protein FlhA